MTAQNRDKLHTWAIRTIESLLHANVDDYILHRVIEGITVHEQSRHSNLVEFVGFVRVQLASRVTSDDLATVMRLLDQFTNFDPTKEAYADKIIDGIRYVIGDGDDTEAVYLENGAVCIWLRGWKEEDSPSPITSRMTYYRPTGNTFPVTARHPITCPECKQPIPPGNQFVAVLTNRWPKKPGCGTPLFRVCETCNEKILATL